MARIISKPVEHTILCQSCLCVIGYTARDVHPEYAEDPTGYSQGPKIGEYVSCPGCHGHIDVTPAREDYDDI